VEIGSQVYRFWTLEKRKNPQKGVDTALQLCYYTLMRTLRNFTCSKKIALGVAFLLVAVSFQLVSVRQAFAYNASGSIVMPNSSVLTYVIDDDNISASSTQQWCSLNGYYPQDNLVDHISTSPTCYNFSFSFPVTSYDSLKFELFSDFSFTNQIYTLVVEKISGVWYFNGFSTFDNTTGFRSFIPQNGSTVATGTVIVGFDFYLNINDWDYLNNDQYFSFRIRPSENYDMPRPDIIIGPIFATTSGMIHISTTTNISYVGRQSIIATFWEPTFHIFGFPVAYYEKFASTSIFIVSTTSPLTQYLDNIRNSIFNNLASSTTYFKSLCNPLSSSFDLDLCLVGLIVPSESELDYDLATLRNMPPWGYVFRAYDIFANSASSSLVVLSATVPSILPGAGSHIELDLNGILDSTLNATSSFYSSVEATSTETFYEITSRYWNILVYVALGFYVFRRLLGSKLIGKTL